VRRHAAVKERDHVSVTEVDLGLLRIGLRRLQVGLRGVALVRLRLDGEQRRAFFHVIVVGITDRLHETLHPGDEIDGVDSGRVAGRFEILRY